VITLGLHPVQADGTVFIGWLLCRVKKRCRPVSARWLCSLHSPPPGGMRSGAPVDPAPTCWHLAILTKTGVTNVPSPGSRRRGPAPITGAAIPVSCDEVTGTLYAAPFQLAQPSLPLRA
jgi:hypothetical protein